MKKLEKMLSDYKYVEEVLGYCVLTIFIVIGVFSIIISGYKIFGGLFLEEDAFLVLYIISFLFVLLAIGIVWRIAVRRKIKFIEIAIEIIGGK